MDGANSNCEIESDKENSSQVLGKVNIYHEQEELNNQLQYCKPTKNVFRGIFENQLNFNFVQCFLSIFPIFSWLPKYSWKRDFIADFITGCTVAVMHIPQGMGYALLGSVSPVVGIYMAFFPVIVYTILGTSQHNSMGTFAVVSIMVGKVVRSKTNMESNQNNSSIVEFSGHEGANYTPEEIASAVCLTVGLIQLGMFICRLGIMSSLLSEALVSGFTTGSSIHVLTSQVKDLFGISLPKVAGNFEIVLTYLNLFDRFSTINWTALGISAFTIGILVVNNEVIKQRIANRCSFPIPIELVAVLVGTTVSSFLDLHANYNVRTIGNIPTGFPDFVVPKSKLLSEVLVPSIPIAMVSYSVTVSMAIIFAHKLNYEVNFNQELLAMGAGNVFGSFFSCMPFAASLSRSTIQQTVGGRTQIASLVSCGLLAMVLLWVGPFFEPLPNCVLASIIVVSLKGMLMQVRQLFSFWRLSRLDALVWIVSFLTVVIVAIDIGLLVGIILSLACLLVKGMKPYTCLLGHVPGTDLYVDVSRYKAAKELPSIKIFHYCGSINFASRTIFKTELFSLINIDLPREIMRLTKSSKNYNGDSLKCLILDFSALSYIDPSGVAAVSLLIKNLRKLSISVYIAGSSCNVYETFKKCGLKESSDGQLKLFPTVKDAVHYAVDIMQPISVIGNNQNCTK